MTKQFFHNFKGWNGVPSQCLIRIFSDDGDHFILFENIGIGLSVTNASEKLVTEILAKIGYHPDDCRFFETYSEFNYDTFDEITYKWEYNLSKGWVASDASWKPAPEFKDLFLN